MVRSHKPLLRVLACQIHISECMPVGQAHHICIPTIYVFVLVCVYHFKHFFLAKDGVLGEDYYAFTQVPDSCAHRFLMHMLDR